MVTQPNKVKTTPNKLRDKNSTICQDIKQCCTQKNTYDVSLRLQFLPLDQAIQVSYQDDMPVSYYLFTI